LERTTAPETPGKGVEMSAQSSRSFKLGTWLLGRIVSRIKYEGFFSEIEEMYEIQVAEKGKLGAKVWFWLQIIRTLPHYFRHVLYWNFTMAKSYMKVTMRNIRRQKSYSFINIAGLSVGITLFILIMSFVFNELNYDRFHTNLNRIYQIGSGDHNGTPVPMAELLRENFPEIPQIARFRNNYHSQLFRYKDGFFKISESYFADPGLFEMFTFPVIKGDAKTALSNPFSLVLTESESRKIFGMEDPIGKTINYDNQADFTVTAVVEDLPQNSSISFGALISFSSLGKVTRESVNWGHWSSQTYLLLPDEHDFRAVEENIRGFLHGMYETEWSLDQAQIADMAFSLRPMKDLYFDKFRGGRFKHGSLQNVYIFTVVAFIILVIAGINFVNLTTARASIRANEVGVRKVLGSFKGQLRRQFLVESVVLSLIATGFASFFVLLLKPRFYNLIGKTLEVDFFSSPFHIVLLMGGALVVGISSGLYPAIYLTSFKPVDTLSGRSVKGAKGATYRKVLTVFQFSMSIILIIGTITVSRQLRYINTKDLGFNKDYLVWFDMSNSIKRQINVFRDKLLANPNIEKFATSRYSKPGIATQWTFRTERHEANCNVFLVDADYVETMGIQIVDGTGFPKKMSGDGGPTCILNETTVKEFELDPSVGNTIRAGEARGIIVGVVKDFYFRSLHHEIEPLVLVYNPPSCTIANIRISPHNVSESLAYIGEVWNELSPDHPFEYYFMDESYDRLYRAEEKFQQIFMNFAILAIIIAGMGLLGLASYLAAQRTKEIGIRKVLGASTSGIVFLLSKEFSKWILFANVLAWPIATIFMRMWLANYAYRVRLDWWIFLMAGALAVIIALLTISLQAFKAAIANPADSLRYE
jgi:putative ABC transport system permease protein